MYPEDFMGNLHSANNVRKARIVPVRRDEKSISINSKNQPNRRLSIPVFSARIFSKKEEVFKILSKRVMKGEDLCQREQELRDTFVEFLMSGKWMDKLSAFIVEQLIRQRPTDFMKEVALSEYSVYSRGTGTKKSSMQDYKDREEVSTRAKYYVQLKVRDAMETNANMMKNAEQVHGLNFTTNQLKDLLITTVWPIFVDSEEFMAYQKKHTQEHPHEREFDEISIRTFSSPSASFTELSNRSDLDRTQRLKTLYDQVIHSMSKRELAARVKAAKYTTSVLNAIQDYPLATFIAHVNAPEQTAVASPKPRRDSMVSSTKVHVGSNSGTHEIPSNNNHNEIILPQEFPIVFVNKFFESLTQYEPHEVLGYNNIEFLSCSKTEIQQVDKIKDAITKGLGVKVAITNARKDGTSFYNFLALRPVYDQKGNYIFVVGVLYDITRQDASLQDIKMIEDYLTLVCNVLKG